MKKILWRVVAVVLVLVVVAVLAVMFFLDGIVKKGVETVGTSVTKVPVTVGAVHISLLGGSGSIKDLAVGNPEGYKTPHAISVGKAGLALQIGSILSDKIVIKSIEVKAPEITLDGTLNGILRKECNLTKILDNVKGAPTTASAPAAQTSTSSAKPTKKLQVDNFLISDAKVQINVEGYNEVLKIPTIHFTNLGTGPEGITASELLERVLQEVVDESIKAAGNISADVLKNKAGKALDNAKDKVSEGLNNLLKKK